MTLAVVALSFVAVGFAGATAVLAVKNGKLRARKEAAEQKEAQLADALEQAARTNTDLEKSRDAEVSSLKLKLATLRGRIDALPDSDDARRIVLADLDSMLQDEEAADDNG